MNPIFYPLIVILVWSILTVLIKDTSIGITYGIGIAFISGVIFVSILLFFWLGQNPSPVFTLKTLAYLAFIGVARYIIGMGFYYKSIRIGDLSISVPLSASKPFFVSIISLLFKAELLDTRLVISVIFATLGAFMLTLDTRHTARSDKKRLYKSIVLALCASLVWSISDILVKKIDYLHSTLITFGSILAAAIMYYVFIIASGKLKNLINMSTIDKKRYLLAGIFSFGLGYLLINVSIIKVGVVRTNTIIALWPVIASFIGFRKYRENLSFARVVGMFMLIACFIIAVRS